MLSKIIFVIAFIRTFLKKIQHDFVGAFATQAAFFIIISFFPFVLFLLTMIQYLPINKSDLLQISNSIFPTVINSYIVTVINEIYSKTTGTIISISAVVALWSASRGFVAIVRGLNSVYGIEETRNYILLRIVSSIYTLLFAITIIITLGFLVFGNNLYIWITNLFPILNDLALLIISIRTIVSLCIFTLFFLALYLFIPNHKSHILAELPGALVSASGWIGFSYLYSFYVNNIMNYSRMYGSFAAIALLMLWLYFCMYILFIGAEINLLFQNSKLVELVKTYRKRKKTK